NALLKTKNLHDRREQNWRLGLLQVGIIAVFVGVPTMWWALTVIGAIGISAAVIWHGFALWHRMRVALPGRFRITIRYYLVAASMLPVGALFGVLLARGLTGTWHGRLLVAHTMINLLGWVGLTILGTLLTLWPTMLRTRMAEGAERHAITALPILAVGLVIAVLAPVVDLAWVGVAGIVIYTLGVAMSYRAIWQAARSRAPHSFPTLSAGAGLVWFIAGLITLSAKVATTPWSELAISYGVVTVMFLVGFALQVLLGALSYLIPVVIGGGPAVLRHGMQALNKLGTWRVATANLAIFLCLLPVPSIVRVVLSSVALVALGSSLVIMLIGIYATMRKKRAIQAEVDAAGGPSQHARLAGPRQPGVKAPAYNPKASPAQVVAAVAVVAVAAAFGVGLDPASAGFAMPTAANQTEEVQPTGEVTEIDVEARDMRFFPDSVEVPVGNELIINLTNTDEAEVHDLVFENGANSGRLSPGESTTLEVGVIEADLDGWCSIVGHRQMGMVFDVVALGDGADEQAPTHSHPTAPSTGDGAGADLDFQASWPQDFERYDPALEPARETTTHQYTFEVTEENIEVAPGVKQTRWTFNGDSTGPTLRGNIGDTFEITLINNGTMGHSIDFHASELAPDEPMRTIAPGESLVYTFEAKRAGIWMYHCGTAPMTAHIAGGMAGAVIIDPPDLDDVDHEFIITQSELYLGEQGDDVDAGKASAEELDAVMFNGYVNQYVDQPLQVKVGERVRFWVLDIGPNRALSFHIVGGQFHTVFKEGTYLLRNGRGPMDPQSYSDGGSQALDLLAAQGGFVELDFVETGHYPMVNHIMTDAERGAMGIVEVTD
ncbi:MAG TPA: multicopper oxidase domain-containing protein, partial [Beutenbergiaceae bacterium]|nr:multicopper oxidase domain-containing protein [Beutenbergiaceae bacterium]